MPSTAACTKGGSPPWPRRNRTVFPVSKSAGIAVPSSRVMERSTVTTLPARATAALRALVAEEKERRVVERTGVEGRGRRKAKVVVGKRRRRTTARVRGRREEEEVGEDGGILSCPVLLCGEGGRLMVLQRQMEGQNRVRRNQRGRMTAVNAPVVFIKQSLGSCL